LKSENRSEWKAERCQPKDSVQAKKNGTGAEVSRQNHEVRVDEVKSYARKGLELKLKGVELSQGFYVD
jgi:hypothetical protein